jgi:hypothetical protein
MAKKIPAREEHRSAWLSAAGRLAAKQNLGLWLDHFVPWITGLSLGTALLVLILRTFGVDFEPVLLVYAGAILVLALSLALYLRNRFSDRMDGLVRLDYRLRLHNRLTSAYSGVGPWPARPEKVHDGMEWRWGRLLVPVAFGVIFLLTAMQIPISKPDFGGGTPDREPLAWSQAESWLEDIAEEEIIEQDVVEQYQEKIESLRSQEPEQWFDHGSLEAGESLRDNLEKGMFDLQTYLAAGRQLLEQASESQGMLSEGALEKMNSQYQEALQGLQNGMLPLDKATMAQLRNMDLSKMSQLSPEQLKRLTEKMGQCKGTLAQCLGMKPGGTKPAQLMRGKLGTSGQQFGRGGVTRGPGAAPLTLKEETDLGTNNLEGVTSQDYENAMMGDKLTERAANPEDQISEYQGLQQAGAVAETGQGGEAVWRDNLSAEERRLLQNYFQ